MSKSQRLPPTFFPIIVHVITYDQSLMCKKFVIQFSPALPCSLQLWCHVKLSFVLISPIERATLFTILKQDKRTPRQYSINQKHDLPGVMKTYPHFAQLLSNFILIYLLFSFLSLTAYGYNDTDTLILTISVNALSSASSVLQCNS